MNSSLLALLVATSGAGAGCGDRNRGTGSSSDKPLADRPPPATQIVQEKPYGTTMQPTTVREGPLPLVYLNPSGASFTFSDLTAKRDLGGSFVDAGEIIRIDKNGIFAGRRAIATMKLDESHRYGIVFQPDPTSVMRKTTGQPTPPTSQP
jgi:hypothetical protein